MASGTSAEKEEEEALNCDIDNPDGLRSALGFSKKKPWMDVTEQLGAMSLSPGRSFTQPAAASPSGDAAEKRSTTWYTSVLGAPTGHSLLTPSGTAPPEETKPKTTSKYEYDFTHKCRGVAHVFVNIEFDECTEQAPRSGAGHDMVNFVDAFKRLGFKVTRHQNETVQHILKAIRDYCKEDHTDDDCVAFAFSSHGDQSKLKPEEKLASDVVYGQDGFIKVSLITELLSETSCPHMANKPKLFFFQACRGDQLSETVMKSETGHVVPRSCSKLESDKMQPVEIPLHKDYFIAFASPPGFFAFRRKEVGSWFVTALLEVIKEKSSKPVELVELMTAVSHRMAVGESNPPFISHTKDPIFDKRMMIPWVASMLTKTVIFAP